MMSDLDNEKILAGIKAAEDFIAAHGESMEAAMETAIMMCFDKEIEGTPSRCSQYGVPYDTIGIAAAILGRDVHQVAIEIAGTLKQTWLDKHAANPVIVWRRRPMLKAAAIDDEPVIVCRFRAHTMKEIPECLP